MQNPSQRVLLIDPEDSSGRAIAAALERRGLLVRAARDLGAGFELEPDPAVVVAQLSAFDVRDAARLQVQGSANSKPELLLLLNRPRAEDLRRALRLGAADVLCQPFRVEDLVEALAGLARRAPRSRPEARTNGPHSREYPAAPETVERAARELSAFALLAGAGPTCRARLASACAEIVHNACQHAYPAGGGTVAVEAAVVGRDLVVHVTDAGRGFDASTALHEALELGFERGLGRAGALAEGLDVESLPGRGSRVVLRFGALRASFESPDRIDLTEADFLLPDSMRRVLDTLRTDADEIPTLSPALAVLVGRLLAGPDPRRALPMALWS